MTHLYISLCLALQCSAVPPSPSENHSVVQTEADCVLLLAGASPFYANTRSLTRAFLNYSSTKTLAKITLKTPAPLYLPLLFRYKGSVLPWSLSSWLQTTTQMKRKRRGTEGGREKPRAGGDDKGPRWKLNLWAEAIQLLGHWGFRARGKHRWRCPSLSSVTSGVQAKASEGHLPD